MKKTIAKVVFLTGILVAFSGTTSFALEWIQVNLQSLSTEATSTELYDLSSTNLRSLWGSGADDIYVAGDIGPTGKGTVIRYNGSEWKVANFTPADADRGLLSVWGIDDENVFIGANTRRTIYHFNGSGWNKISSNTINGNTIAGFWGESVNKIWTPGSLKVILGYEYNMQYLDIDSSDANKAVNQPSTEYRMNLNGVWGSSESNVYVVGEYGCKISWGSCIDGTESNIIHTSEWKGDFTAVDTGSTATLYAIWGTAADDIFAVGAAGTVLHYDGSAWTAMATPANTPDLKAVWGLSGASVYAVGNDGTILYYNGSAWAEQASDTTEDLTGIWGAASDDIFITGTGGTLLSSGAETPQPVCGDGKIEGDETCEADEDCPSGSCVDCTCQTLVTLEQFVAAAGNRQVELTWMTSAEIDNAGFNIYRSVNGGAHEQINKALIPAEGSPTQGAAYRFVDEGLNNRKNYSYTLEDLDLNGIATIHGPVTATPRFMNGTIQ